MVFLEEYEKDYIKIFVFRCGERERELLLMRRRRRWREAIMVGRDGSLIKWASGTWERRKKNNGKACFIFV